MLSPQQAHQQFEGMRASYKEPRRQPIVNRVRIVYPKAGTCHWTKTRTKGYSLSVTQYDDGTWEVYALDGHELLPVTRKFTEEVSALKWANEVWRRY